jgi:hypothetical protein
LTTTVGKLTAQLDQIQTSFIRPSPTVQPIPPQNGPTVNSKVNTTANNVPATTNTSKKPTNNMTTTTSNRTNNTTATTTPDSDSSGWQKVEPKKHTVKPRYPIAEQKVVCQLGPDSPLDKSPEGTADYLKRANKAINNLTKEPGVTPGPATVSEGT